MRHLFFLATAVCLAACKPSSDRYTQSVTIDLPPAVPVDSINLADADASPVRRPAAAPAAEAARPAAAPAPREAADEPRLVLASAATPEAVEPAAAETVPAAPLPEPAAAAPSRPALSDAMIAHTLGRIGFPCGRVVSTSPVEDGAWRIECSSGASYRGSDRSGRMRFKRW